MSLKIQVISTSNKVILFEAIINTKLDYKIRKDYTGKFHEEFKTILNKNEDYNKSFEDYSKYCEESTETYVIMTNI